MAATGSDAYMCSAASCWQSDRHCKGVRRQENSCVERGTAGGVLLASDLLLGKLLSGRCAGNTALLANTQVLTVNLVSSRPVDEEVDRDLERTSITSCYTATLRHPAKEWHNRGLTRRG
jgi:hypothetical protein